MKFNLVELSILKILLIVGIVVQAFSCSADLKDAEEALRDAQEARWEEKDDSSSSNGPSSSSSLPDGYVLCFNSVSGSCVSVSVAMCAATHGTPVDVCPASSSSVAVSSSSGVSSLSSSSSVILTGYEYCQIYSSCIETPEVTCLIAGGTPVASCNLTCSMSATTGIYGTRITPDPIVECNDFVVSSGITWTPTNLIPTSSGSVAVSAKVANCNNATAICGTIEVPEPIILSEDFEGTAPGWYVLGSNINKWYIGGTSTYYLGSKSAYVSSGTAYTYNISSTSTSNLYTTIDFPPSTIDFTLSFWYKGEAEGIYDNMSVYLMPTSGTTLTSAVPNSSYLIGESHYSGATYRDFVKITIPLLAVTYSEKRYYLVFHWKNDGSYGTSPAAIDNIEIKVNP
ncbi:MAG: hypothetical protein FWC15_03125 [Fibromonadales bacterium]|nr:hypothetical protein [Fibromonadales bacterium]